ncbi:MAG: ABC transporter substrate-binding protein [Cyanobacteria bacterium P01_D01_bin.105]
MFFSKHISSKHISFEHISSKYVQLPALAFVGCVALLGTSLTSCENGAPVAGSADEAPFVAIAQTIQHPGLDSVSKGIKDSLMDAGYTDDESLRWEWRSARGNPATAAQIASKYVRAKPDVIVAIASLTAQAAVTATKTTPVIFSAVTDPVGADLIEDIEKPGGLISGVSNLPPIDQHMTLMREVLPAAKTIGVIYNPEEAHAINLVALVQEEAPKQNFTEIQKVTVSASEDVDSAARSLVGMVDAIYIPRDNTVAPVLESVIQVGQDNNLPVFAEDAESVKRGAIAGISVDYYDAGRQTGEMVIKILKGNRVGDLPVESVNVVQLFVNPTAAAKMGVTLPKSVVERAEQVIE